MSVSGRASELLTLFSRLLVFHTQQAEKASCHSTCSDTVSLCFTKIADMYAVTMFFLHLKPLEIAHIYFLLTTTLAI
jgi:hypothetical protein